MDDTPENRKGRKVKIEIDPDGPEEIVIRCRSMTPEINALKTLIERGKKETGEVRELALRLGETEHFVALRVGFTGCTKQAYVSRLYYRPFREKLEEMRSIIK